MNTADILKKGYLPSELPPPFTTFNYGVLYEKKLSSFPNDFYGTKKSPIQSLSCVHNLSRVGSLRRKLSIPNPINFTNLAEQISKDWVVLSAHCNKSMYSMSTPDLSNTKDRAIGRKYSLDQLPLFKAKTRATSRYILSTDISTYYPTVYTHSIPWALSTKKAAKSAKFSSSILGNDIDKYSRNCQDGQTIGIPIGPDTSLVIAEVILTAVDLAFNLATNSTGFRYMDDYEYGYKSFSEAEESLAILQSILHEYGLQLNPSKTIIKDLPEPAESVWTSELRIFQFRETASSQKYDLIRYFDRSFELSKSFPSKPVLKYAIARILNVNICKENWELFQHYLLQCISSEPGTLKLTFEHLKFYLDAGYSLDKVTLEQALSNIIFIHAPLGHGSEVAWALWGAILFNLNINQAAVDKLINLEDPVVALLALHANSLSLLGSNFMSPLWNSLMTIDELTDENWLLAYEANIKGWLSGVGGVDNISGHTSFNFLKSEGIHFYDINSHSEFKSIKQKKKKNLLRSIMSFGVGGGY